MRYLLILLTTFVFANSPICEIYNEDTGQCELLADQNFTINQEWMAIINE